MSRRDGGEKLAIREANHKLGMQDREFKDFLVVITIKYNKQNEMCDTQ